MFEPKSPTLSERVIRRYSNLLKKKMALPVPSHKSQMKLEDLYHRGYCCLNENNLDEATATFAFLALQQPMDRRFLFAFACTLKLQKEYRQALSLFSHTFVMQANDPFAPFHMAECLQALNEPDAAKDALNTVISLCYGQSDNDPRYDPLRQQAQTLLDNIYY